MLPPHMPAEFCPSSFWNILLRPADHLTSGGPEASCQDSEGSLEHDLNQLQKMKIVARQIPPEDLFQDVVVCFASSEG